MKNASFNINPVFSILSRWILAAVLILALSFSASSPYIAYADVRESDLILGETIEQNGLSIDDCPDIAAEYVYLVDSKGTVYFQRNDTNPTQIASITKIMTAIVALDQVPEDFVITVSDSAADIGESSAKLESGDTMTLNEALKALLIPSGNDAAQAIAESVGGYMLGSWDDPAASCQTFVDAMNAKAEELGMINTLFSNPHGLDDEGFESDQHSSAYDVAILCAFAMENETFRNIASSAEISCTITRGGVEEVLNLSSTDTLIGKYDGACGIKTGFTDTAGGCFAGACNRDENVLYAIVLKSTDESSRFNDTEVLWDWVYNNMVEYPLASSNETATDEITGKNVPLVAKVSATSWIDKTVKATLENPEQTVTIFALKGDVEQTTEYKTLEGTINAGDKVGTITYTQGDEVIATANLVATETVEGPGTLDKIAIWFKRLIGSISGTPRQAQSELINETMLVNDKKLQSS